MINNIVNWERKKKTDERMNKIVIKGRRVMNKTLIEKKVTKVEDMFNVNEENDGNDMLQVETTENNEDDKV